MNETHDAELMIRFCVSEQLAPAVQEAKFDGFTEVSIKVIYNQP